MQTYRRLEHLLVRDHVQLQAAGDDTAANLTRLDELTSQTQANSHARLEAARLSGAMLPRLVRLEQHYGLIAGESLVVGLLVLLNSAKTHAFRAQIVAYSEFSGSYNLFLDLCGISKVELDSFFAEDRKYIKDGVVT